MLIEHRKAVSETRHRSLKSGMIWAPSDGDLATVERQKLSKHGKAHRKTNMQSYITVEYVSRRDCDSVHSDDRENRTTKVHGEACGQKRDVLQTQAFPRIAQLYPLFLLLFSPVISGAPEVHPSHVRPGLISSHSQHT